MGGYGSTRWNGERTKLTVEDCLILSTKTIKNSLQAGAAGSLTWSREGQRIAQIGYSVEGNNENPTKVILSYSKRVSGQKQAYEYHVDLTTTPLPWGGERYWLRCPLKHCGRRVAKLYLPNEAEYFGCRRCYRLSYASKNEKKSWRALDNMMLKAMMEGGMSRKKARKMFRAGEW